MPSADPGVRILSFGDGALLVELLPLGVASGVSDARRARLFASAIRDLRTSSPALALGEPVAAAASVLVPFDPLSVDAALLARRLAPLAAALPVAPPPDADARPRKVRVRFGGDDGPDLAAVAAETGLTEAAVVDLLAASELEVLFLGFAPGFGYLGDLPAELAVPRLAVPRTRVPAGSVAITGQWAGIYPQASAGGWRLVGATDAKLFDPSLPEPALLRAGDRVRLVPA